MRPPDSPPAALQALLSAAGELGLGITAGQADALLAHLDLLQRWNATYNLTAVRDPGAMLSQHLIDCLALVPALKRHLDAHPQARRLLDAGSGGGLPGVVLAVMSPTLDVTCVDAVGKKAAFVRQVAGALALPNLHAVHARVEALNSAPFDVITSRAFASLADFVRWTDSRLAAGGVWLAMKGRAPDDEVAELPNVIEVFHVEPLQVPGLAAQRCLVWMRRMPER
jgi:16S rRNA (guanine527-N7)-methyltransferase